MIEKAKGFLEKNSKKIGVTVAAVVAVGFGAYLYAKSGSAEDKERESRTVNSENASFVGEFVKSDKYQQTVASIRAVLIQTQGRIPNEKVLMIIVQVTVELYKTRFSALYLQNRTDRRKLLKTPDLYAQKVEEGNNLGEQLFENATTVVLQDIGIDHAHYDEELEKATLMDPNFSRYVTFLYSNVKVQVNQDNSVKLDEAKVMEYFQTQIDEISSGALEQFDSLEQTQAMMCKQTYLGDVASLKMGFEEEAIAQDPRLLSLPAVLLKHQELAVKLREAIGLN